MEASYRLFKKKKEQTAIKTNRNKAEGQRIIPKPIVGEANLPHEIIIKIFEYSGPFSVLKISRTCRFWHETRSICSKDSGLWRHFVRASIYDSLINNYEDGTKAPKEAICHQFCEKQMKLLKQVKEEARSAPSNNFWKDKFLTMLIDDIRALYSRKQVMPMISVAPKMWKNDMPLLKYMPDGNLIEEEFDPESIYKVVALINSDNGSQDFSGVFQTTDGYYLLLNCWHGQVVKHWDLEVLLARHTSPYMRETWHLPLLQEFGKYWSSSHVVKSIPAEFRWFLIKAGLKLIKSCDKCYNDKRGQRSWVLGGGISTGSLEEVDSLYACEVCSGTGDAWIFEAIDAPHMSSSYKKTEREVYSAQQVLLRISTQWRKHKEQMIDRQINAVLEKNKAIIADNNTRDEAANERKRKFDELVSTSNVFNERPDRPAKRFKLLASSTDEIENLQMSGGWNTWLATKGSAGIESFARRLKDHRPLPYLTDLLYPTHIALGCHALDAREWLIIASSPRRFSFVLNNELFAPYQIKFPLDVYLADYIAQHPSLPRASMCSFGMHNLALWKRSVLLHQTGLPDPIFSAEHYK